MDIKLKFMKKVFVLITVVFISSCSTYKRTKFEYNLGKEKNEWINNYKTEFFLKCIKKAYKNDSIFKLIVKQDLLYLYEPSANQNNQIDSLSTIIIKNIPKPIFQHCDDCTIKEEKEELQKNYFCASCLNFYASRELDSLAKKEYKKYLKNNRDYQKALNRE